MIDIFREIVNPYSTTHNIYIYVNFARYERVSHFPKIPQVIREYNIILFRDSIENNAISHYSSYESKRFK
jgi:hypothetical protein